MFPSPLSLRRSAYALWLLGAMLSLIAPMRAARAQAPAPAWAARYHTTSDSIDTPTAMAVDAAGNVYVTGNSQNSSGNVRCATVKYDAQGNQLWTALYNASPASANVLSLSLDAGSNVYVSSVVFSSSSFSSDLVTVKYDTSGNQLWAHRSAGIGGNAKVKTDAAGNTVVCGSSISGLVILKYDADGNQLWSDTYGGAAGANYSASNVVVDAQGNIYTTGSVGGVLSGNTLIYSAFITAKYDAQGNQLWTARYQGDDYWSCASNGIALDAQGNVYITGASDTFYRDYNSDVVTIKYDNNGNQLWVKRYNGGDGYKYGGSALILDAQSNVYVSAYYNSTYYNQNAGGSFLLKYDTNGNLLWVRRDSDGGPGSLLSIDALGSLYAVVYTSTPTSYSSALVKYDANGAALWRASYQGPGGVSDIAKLLVVDAQGSVYTAGAETPAASGPFTSSPSSYVTLKYSVGAAGIADITAQVSVTRSGLRFVRATGLWTQTVTVRNTGVGSFPGPLYLVLDGLNAGVTLSNRGGVTSSAPPAGSPYLSSGLNGVGNQDSMFDPGESVTFTLSFADPSGAALTYTPRVLAGSGTP